MLLSLANKTFFCLVSFFGFAFFFFFEKGSDYVALLVWTCYVDQAGLEFIEDLSLLPE